ncbi:basic 7S globulin-like [Quillaja saponaria]|uniref:Basic 7S globulin-like n=1 Tax=Quillaja saponaria TaxID=32244 RepID=A0AAD7LC20_QUISA|nr:basic 7S globulin-like [Quillaja saponaria]
MATTTIALFLFSIAFVSSISSSNAQPNKQIQSFFHLPVKIDRATHQYYTTTDIGTPESNYFDLVIHLGGQFLWFDCNTGYNSSTYHPIKCGTRKCKIAKGIGCVGCNGPLKPGCTNNTCGMSPYNPFNNFLVSGDLGEDRIGVFPTEGATVPLSAASVPHFLSVCVDSDRLSDNLLGRMAKNTKGIVGLARTQIALPTQLALTFKLPNRFALCLPSSTKNGFGDLFVGGGPYFLLPYTKDVSQLLVKVPLVINPVSTAPVFSDGEPSDEYFIDVKSIKIDGEVVNFNTSLLSIHKNGDGGTKLSTINRYTMLHTSIYKALVNDFVKKAAAKKIARVASVGRFGACFNSNTIARIITGPAVPNIDLVFLNERVHWRISGANSMVKVGKNVLCLAFVDGGENARTSIVIGGHQMENNLLEFDLASSKLGFTSSLLLHNTSCSHFRLV